MKCNVFEKKNIKNKDFLSYDRKISLITVLRAGGLFISKISLVLIDIFKVCQISEFSLMVSVKCVNFCNAGYDYPLIT